MLLNPTHNDSLNQFLKTFNFHQLKNLGLSHDVDYAFVVMESNLEILKDCIDPNPQTDKGLLCFSKSFGDLYIEVYTHKGLIKLDQSMEKLTLSTAIQMLTLFNIKE